MPFPSQPRRSDEKLGLILAQLSSVRTRLNSLALQYAAFFTLSIVIAAIAVVFAGAHLLTPMGFLICGAAAVILGTIGLAATIRTAWRMHASARVAAAIADDRAGLKERLSTIVAIAGRADRGALWPYLVEDTLSYRAQFAAPRIERRRISRSIFTLIAALALASVAIPLTRNQPAPQIAVADGGNELAFDLNDLHLRPEEPGEEGGMEVTADPATMRKLREKLAREHINPGGTGGNSLSHLMNHARDLAGDVQNKLTGRHRQQTQRLTLHLADAGNRPDQNEKGGAPDPPKNTSNEPAGQFQQEHSQPSDPNLPPTDNTRHTGVQQKPGDGSDAGNEPGAGKDNSNHSQDAGAARSNQQSGEQGSGGGSAHGIGADPDSLFGDPAPAKLGSEGFEIAIEARPVDHGAKGAGHAYMPPKVRTPLSAKQEPDEPVARASVPSEDRTTIKRVFER